MRKDIIILKKENGQWSAFSARVWEDVTAWFFAHSPPTSPNTDLSPSHHQSVWVAVFLKSDSSCFQVLSNFHKHQQQVGSIQPKTSAKIAKYYAQERQPLVPEWPTPRDGKILVLNDRHISAKEWQPYSYAWLYWFFPCWCKKTAHKAEWFCVC